MPIKNDTYFHEKAKKSKMALSKLRQPSLKLILFGGKGGVGKTTCASSTGLYLAQEFKTLIISTDPAHSLSDSLGYEIGDQIKKINDINKLDGIEIDAEKALWQFKKENEEEIRQLLDTSTYLDDEDIDSLYTLPIPGIDEVMGFKSIIDLMEKKTHEKYIVDTAPTGHALRLLTLPGLLDEWIKVMAKMRWKYRYMRDRFAGASYNDQVDDLLIKLKKSVKSIQNLLKDKNQCEFIVVTIPTKMAILETERLINKLNNYGITVRQLVINNASNCKKACNSCEEYDFCDGKRKEEEENIYYLRKRFADLEISIMFLQPHEVKGIERLNIFKEFLFSDNNRHDYELKI